MEFTFSIESSAFIAEQVYYFRVINGKMLTRSPKLENNKDIFCHQFSLHTMKFALFSFQCQSLKKYYLTFSHADQKPQK